MFVSNRYETFVDKVNKLQISHSVYPDFKFFYEPFYVAPDSVPPHDERFVGYGFTRNTQVRNGVILISDDHQCT